LEKTLKLSIAAEKRGKNDNKKVAGKYGANIRGVVLVAIRPCFFCESLFFLFSLVVF
jgi:hypothetical protein